MGKFKWKGVWGRIFGLIEVNFQQSGVLFLSFFRGICRHRSYTPTNRQLSSAHNVIANVLLSGNRLIILAFSVLVLFKQVLCFYAR